MEKTILYYKFIKLDDPDMTRLWQIELCTRLGLKGRIIVSYQGINGTLGGTLKSLRAYKSAMNKSGIFRGIDYKWDNGGVDDFPRLSVKVRDELVSFRAPNEVIVDKTGIKGGGKHLKPQQLHRLLEEKGDQVVFFDGRNKYEAAIGKFKGAVVPDVENTRDFIAEIEKPIYDKLKSGPVVTYCTGGVRCEILTALMKKRGFKEVYQLDGGIVKYGQKYGDKGAWEGKLHTFNNRMLMQFSEEAKDIGECVHCQSKTSRYINCGNVWCNKLILVCQDCGQTDKNPGTEICKKCVHDSSLKPVGSTKR